MKESRIVKLESLIDVGQKLVENAKRSGSSETLWKTMVGRESIKGSSEMARGQVEAATADYQSITSKKLGAAAQRASNMILAAAHNPLGFVTQVAQESTKDEYSNYLSAGFAGATDVDYGKNFVGQEYYSDKDLDKNLGLSWTLNVRSLETQSRFAETLYPTITVDSNDVGITIRTKITTVTRGVMNALLAKDSVLDNRRPLHDALTDHRVLQDDAIRIVPYIMEDGKNSEFFVDPAIIENTTVQLGRVPVYPTNYLNFEQPSLNLFRLAAHPGIVTEGYDETDEIAPGAALGEILLSVRKKAESLADGALFKINTRDMQYSTFQRPAEGGGRELLLNFRATVFTINGASKDWKGNEMPALDALKANDYSLRFVISVNMSMHTTGDRSGFVEITGKSLRVDSVVTKDGTKLPIDSGSVKTMLENITLELYGWRFDGTRTNENRRTQGLMLDPIWEMENYKLQYGSPILTKSPIGQEYDDAERLDDLISAVNIRNESLAVSQTLNYTEQLRDVVANKVTAYDKSAIRGLGRHWVSAWFEELEFDVSKHIQTSDTKDALVNARQGLLNRLGDQVTRAIQESRYMPALRLLTANPDARPVVVIATDEPTASMLLLQQGETRILGDRYQYEVVTTNDDRWRVKDTDYNSVVRRLQWVLRVDQESDGSYCVLNWGNHFWSPVMVTNINIQRNGGVSKELAVQPRNAHINHCPVSGVILIKGITEFVAKKLAYYVELANAPADGSNLGPVTGGTTGGTTNP
ncbi:putative major capsid protein [Erwinia phage vB_EamM_Phobos]|uniref:major head protein n=1 Tax=Erwinia phage vB_EamM_Phobos TaxID=1883377 RepID=UPI00081C7079|nr:major head protein [Erwinia phage vB_EamM_Phobos]ANZ50264.1 putative major capsid protein [Erwinia phage vB_EamM_Phobos]